MFKKICIGLGIFVAVVYVLFLILPFIITPIAKGYIPTIKNAIRKGALSNTLIDTTSDKNINTKAIVRQLENNLGGTN